MRFHAACEVILNTLIISTSIDGSAYHSLTLVSDFAVRYPTQGGIRHTTRSPWISLAVCRPDHPTPGVCLMLRYPG